MESRGQSKQMAVAEDFDLVLPMRREVHDIHMMTLRSFGLSQLRDDSFGGTIPSRRHVVYSCAEVDNSHVGSLLMMESARSLGYI